MAIQVACGGQAFIATSLFWHFRLRSCVSRKCRKKPKNFRFHFQSKREDKPQRFAGTSQLILVQSLLYIKSYTNDCNYTTISFNTIQFAFL